MSKLVIDEIALRILGVTTLESRGRDEFDFYDLSVWTIKAALEAAYKAGLNDAKPTKPIERS